MNHSKAVFLAALLGFCLLLPGASQAADGATPASAADRATAHVRVVTWKGKILLDRKVRTGTTTVRASRRATCLGGSPSDGTKLVSGPTALGILSQAAGTSSPKVPLLVSNAFDFGLGVCGIGGVVAQGEQWWELRLNHEPSMLGGEGTVLKNGDKVLWYLSKSYNETSPDALFLRAPEKVRAGRAFRVRVLAYGLDGKPRPVEGARLSLAGAALSNKGGYVSLRIRRKTRLVARAAGLIPSNRAVVGIRR